MKKNIAETGIGYVILNILLAFGSFFTAYALYISSAHEDKWYPGFLFLLLLMPGKDMLSRKHQKAVIAVSLAAAVIAAVFVISQVGIWILNIRYSAAVFNAAIGVMAVAQLIMYAAERRNEKEAVNG